MGLPTILGQLFLIAALAFLCTYKWSSLFSSEINTALSIAPEASTVNVDTLVIYIFSPTDPEYERNMRFFIEHGMSADDPCHYAIVVQNTGQDLQQELPSLPSNAWYDLKLILTLDLSQLYRVQSSLSLVDRRYLLVLLGKQFDPGDSSWVMRLETKLVDLPA